MGPPEGSPPAGGPGRDGSEGPLLGRVTDVELLWLDLHLAGLHRAAHGEERDRPVVLARVVVGGVEGWGECAALAAPTYRDEYAAGAWAVLRDHLVPRLLGLSVPAVAGPGGAGAAGPGPDPGAAGPGPADPGPGPGGAAALGPVLAAVAGALAPVSGHPMARAALEMAVVDAALVAAGRSLADALGVAAGEVPTGAVVGLAADPADPGDVVAAAERAVAVGHRRVRCKIAPGADAGPLSAVRRALPSVVLQADANAAYDRRSARDLVVLDELALGCLEQPLPADDLLGHAELARRLATPLALDESLRAPPDVDVVGALGAATVLCLKPACLGGIASALDAWHRARQRGMAMFVGGMLQSGLGRAVDAAVAGLPGIGLPGDLGGPGPAFAEEDPFGPVPWRAGLVAVHRGPGVGPRPDVDRLRDVVTRRHTDRAGWQTA